MKLFDRKRPPRACSWERKSQKLTREAPLTTSEVCVAETTPQLEDSFTGILVSWGKPVGVSICFDVNSGLADETRSPMGKPMGVQERLPHTTRLDSATVIQTTAFGSNRSY